MKSGDLDTCLGSPINEHHRSSVVRHGFAVASVARLLARGCPAAVTWLVAAIIVWVAVDGEVLPGCQSHVVKERLEIAAPSLADGYAPPAVSWVRRVTLVGASPDHGTPDVVFSGRLANPGVAVLDTVHCGGFTNPLTLKASATLGSQTSMAVPKAFGGHGTVDAAVANTTPVLIPRRDSSWSHTFRNHLESSATCPGEVDSACCFHVSIIPTSVLDIKKET